MLRRDDHPACNRERLKRRSALWCAVFVLCCGCGEKTVVTSLPEGEQNLRYIAMAYTQVATDRGRSPASLEELKPVLKDFGDPDQLSRSPRDGQPYVIVGGVSLKGPFKNGLPILAYERAGKDGKRQVVDLRMIVREVTAEQFRQLPFPPGYKPPPPP